MPLGDATKWVIRAILKVPEEIASDAVCVAARVVEKLNKTEGLIYLAKGYQQTATGYELEQAKDKRVLLFVHGIFSSIHGAFGDLGDPAATDTTMKKLIDAYSGHVFGYDHWTISKTPLQNALDLLDAIPDQANWDIDVICHSRGGLVVRSLLSVIAEGVEPTNDGLRLVAQRRAGKIKSIDKTFFVAAANQGSPLAIDPATFIRESRGIFYACILKVFLHTLRRFLQSLHVLSCSCFQLGLRACRNPG